MDIDNNGLITSIRYSDGRSQPTTVTLPPPTPNTYISITPTEFPVTVDRVNVVVKVGQKIQLVAKDDDWEYIISKSEATVEVK